MAKLIRDEVAYIVIIFIHVLSRSCIKIEPVTPSGSITAVVIIGFTVRPNRGVSESCKPSILLSHELVFCRGPSRNKTAQLRDSESLESSLE